MIFNFWGLFGPRQGQLDAYKTGFHQNQDRTIYRFSMEDIDGNPVSLSSYKGKVVVIVNVASNCGYTPQYSVMQKFYEQYRDNGVVILGFPSNNFLSQEPGTDEEIKTFCSKNYGVSFPMFSKISVKGPDAAPLYQFLTQKTQNGVMDAPVKWNFQKYIIDKEGKFVTFFDPKTQMTDEKFVTVVQELIKK